MPVWISHRGIRETGFSENSQAAFDLAVERGFDWLETDLRLTADRHIVLTHDVDLARVAGRPSKIAELTRRELEVLRLPCGQSFLFWDDFVRRYSRQNWVFDIKVESDVGCIHKIDEYLRTLPNRSEIESRIHFLFWSREAERLARSLFKHAKFFAGETDCWRAGLSAILSFGVYSLVNSGTVYSVPPDLKGLKLFTKRYFRCYQARGAKVLAYLPTTNDQVSAAIRAGADYVLSDVLIRK